VLILSSKPSRIKREDVINWFGGVEQFIIYHQGVDCEKIDFMIEEDED
jgi:hypothetical protein